MKPGAEDNPLADAIDESEDEREQPSVSDLDESATEEDSGTDGVPWAVERNSVKSEREMVQFFLQEETQAREREFRRAVEDEAEFDVTKTDLREAAYLIAMKHPDEVAELLEEWGCEYA